MFEFSLPDVGEGVAEGELLEWHVEPGDDVAEDDVLAEVETDKAVVDLPSPVAGTVVELHAEPGDVVPVGDVVVTIDPDESGDANATDEDQTATADDGPTTAEEAGDVGPTPAIVEQSGDDGQNGSGAGRSAGGRIFAPPRVRRLARERGVDIQQVAGSGPGGRVTVADVEDVAGASGAADEDVADAITRVEPAATDEGTDPEAEDETPGRRSAIRKVSEPSGGDSRTDAEPAASTGPGEGADRERTLAAPATRRLAEELGVDVDAVPATESADGEPVVTPEDVRDYAQAREEPATGRTTAARERRETRGADDVQSADRPAAPTEGDRERREPYRGVRQTIGKQMEQSAFTVPHVTHHDTAVVTGLVEARDAMRSRAEEAGVRLTYLPLVLRAVVAALAEYPILNTSLDEESEEIVYKHYYDVGVATATDAGLVVPVVRDVDEKGLFELADEVADLTARARDRSIDREEMQGGTFTVTNFGAVGGEYATPIVNHPETAILGLGSIEQRPVVVEGDVVARHTLPLSLSIDHRVIDGAEAARFTNAVIEYLETPSLLLLE